jgi:hypothetical protein
MSKEASGVQKKPRHGQVRSGAGRRTHRVAETVPGGADLARQAEWQKDELRHRAKAAEMFRRM